jgi:hypothetical protein
MADKTAGIENLARMRERQRAEDRPPGLKHGIWAFQKYGRLPEEIAARLEDFETGMISDLGGDVTTAQRTLIETSRMCFGVILLASQWIAENGAVRPGGKPQHILNLLGTYLNTLRLNLLALGLHRRTKSAHTLESIVSEYTTEATNDHS